MKRGAPEEEDEEYEEDEGENEDEELIIAEATWTTRRATSSASPQYREYNTAMQVSVRVLHGTKWPQVRGISGP